MTQLGSSAFALSTEKFLCKVITETVERFKASKEFKILHVKDTRDPATMIGSSYFSFTDEEVTKFRNLIMNKLNTADPRWINELEKCTIADIANGWEAMLETSGSGKDTSFTLSYQFKSSKESIAFLVSEGAGDAACVTIFGIFCFKLDTFKEWLRFLFPVLSRAGVASVFILSSPEFVKEDNATVEYARKMGFKYVGVTAEGQELVVMNLTTLKGIFEAEEEEKKKKFKESNDVNTIILS